MTGAIYSPAAISPVVEGSIAPTLSPHYHIALPEPASHLFEVTLVLRQWSGAVLNLHCPVWTPGSYLVREYARHLQDFSVQGDDRPLPWHKVSKSHWQIQGIGVQPGGAADGGETVTIRYRVFANELTVRTNHLDPSHGYFNPAALLLYVPECLHQPHRVTVTLPHDQWQVATPLVADPEDPHTFIAADYDTLVDSPFELGTHQIIDFEALGQPHQWVIWGKGNLNPAQLVADTQTLIATEAAIFGGLPYQDPYLFLLHLSASGYGGLEHKNSCTLNYPRLALGDRDGYQRFLRLVAHEFFHLWNVKRIRPKGLETFDYAQENYTPSLWFCEGTTSYYDRLIPFRAGLASAQDFLDLMGQDITRLYSTPGRLVQPLSESSFDAWIKLYRRDAHSNNNQISYYLKGEMVTFLLDLQIRANSQNQRSFDQVLQQMWRQFGQPEVGYTEAELQAIIAGVAGCDLTDFFALALHSTEELPFAEALEPFGLSLEMTWAKVPFLGLTLNCDRGQWLVQFVQQGSPAQRVGLEPGDEVLALDGFRLGASLDDRLRDYAPGDTLTLTVFHQDELQTHPITLDLPQPQTYRLVIAANPSPSQVALRQGWLGI